VSRLIEVTVSDQLRVDTALGLYTAWQVVPMGIRREYPGPYYIVGKEKLDGGLMKVKLMLTKEES
jgi:hypothetical protein